MSQFKVILMGTFLLVALNVSTAKSAESAKGGAKCSEKSSPDLIEKGKATYAKTCVVCHGEKFDGDGIAGKALNPKPRNLLADKFKEGETVKMVFNTVSKGLKNTAMAGFEGQLTDVERCGVTHFILSERAKAHKK